MRNKGFLLGVQIFFIHLSVQTFKDILIKLNRNKLPEYKIPFNSNSTEKEKKVVENSAKNIRK